MEWRPVADDDEIVPFKTALKPGPASLIRRCARSTGSDTRLMPELL